MDNSLSDFFQQLLNQYPSHKDLLSQITKDVDAVLKGKPQNGQLNPSIELMNDLEALSNKDIEAFDEVKNKLRGFDKLEKLINVPIQQFIKNYGEQFNEKASELIEQIRKCTKDADEIGTEEKIARKLFEDLDEINFDKSQQLLREHFERDYPTLKLTDTQVIERIHKISQEEDQHLVKIIRENIESKQLRDALFALNLIKLTNPGLAWKIFSHVRQLRIYLKIDKDELGFDTVQSQLDEERIMHIRVVITSLTSENLQLLNNKLPSPQDQEFCDLVKDYWTRAHKFFGIFNNTLAKFGGHKQELKIQLELLNKQCLNFIKNWYIKISSEYFTHKIKAGFENDFLQLVQQAKQINKLLEDVERIDTHDIGKTLLNEEDNIFLSFQTNFPSKVNLAPSNNSLVQKIIRLFEKENQLLIEVIKNKKIDLNKYQFKDEDQISLKKKEIQQVKEKIHDMKGKIDKLEQKIIQRQELVQTQNEKGEGYLSCLNQEYEQQIEIKKLKINQLKDYKSLLKEDITYLEKECGSNEKFCKTNREKITQDIEQDQNKLTHNQKYLENLYKELQAIKDSELKKLQQIQSFIGSSDTSLYNEIYNLIFSLQQKTRFFQEYVGILLNKVKITTQAIFTAQKILECHENEINQNELANNIIVMIRNDFKLNLQLSKDAHNVRQLLFYFYSDGKGEINNEQELCIKIIAKNFLIREIRQITDEDAMIDSIEKFLIFELFDGNREQKYEKFLELKRKKNESQLDDKELKMYSELMNDEPLRKCIMELTKHKSLIKNMIRKLSEEFNKYEDLTQQKLVQESFKTNLIQIQKIIIPALTNSLLMFQDVPVEEVEEIEN